MFGKRLWFETLTFFSDDNDGVELEIFNMPNEDIYVSILDTNRGVKNTVRVCRSGGISTNNPRFMNGVTELYRALAEPIESLIEKAHEMADKDGKEYYIVMNRNCPEIRNEESLEEFINKLFTEQTIYKDFETFRRIFKYRLVKYSTKG